MIKNFFENAPNNSRIEFQAFGGAVNGVPKKATAFRHRKALYWCGFSTLWYNENDQNIHIKWIRELWDEFQKYSNRHSYVNFSDSDLGSKYMKYYYGKNKYKLAKIKKKYDPKYVFNFPQVIRQIVCQTDSC